MADNVLVCCDTFVLKFSSLDEALASQVAGDADPAYESFEHFDRATTPGHVQFYANRHRVDLGERPVSSSEAKKLLWQELQKRAMSEDEARARRVTRQDYGEPEPTVEEELGVKPFDQLAEEQRQSKREYRRNRGREDSEELSEQEVSWQPDVDETTFPVEDPGPAPTPGDQVKEKKQNAGRKPKWELDDVIAEVYGTEREREAKRFIDQYRPGMTVQQALDAGVQKRAVYNDHRFGFIKLVRRAEYEKENS